MPQAHRPLRIALDPGHGGRDPGAVAAGVAEKDVTLAFARAFAAALAGRSDIEAVLTRRDDIFVPLGERIELARRAGADLMISLHADRLAAGEAEGLSVYSLGAPGSAAGPDVATLLRGRYRTRLLEGTDLAGESDALALTLVELARRDTVPAARSLAQAPVAALDGTVPLLDKRPHRHGAFAVLKAADLPAVLVELGFLDNARDRGRLGSPEWRERTIAAMIEGAKAWSAERGKLPRSAGVPPADADTEHEATGEAAAMPAADGTKRHREAFAVQQGGAIPAGLSQ